MNKHAIVSVRLEREDWVKITFMALVLNTSAGVCIREAVKDYIAKRADSSEFRAKAEAQLLKHNEMLEAMAKPDKKRASKSTPRKNK